MSQNTGNREVNRHEYCSALSLWVGPPAEVGGGWGRQGPRAEGAGRKARGGRHSRLHCTALGGPTNSAGLPPPVFCLRTHIRPRPRPRPHLPPPPPLSAGPALFPPPPPRQAVPPARCQPSQAPGSRGPSSDLRVRGRSQPVLRMLTLPAPVAPREPAGGDTSAQCSATSSPAPPRGGCLRPACLYRRHCRRRPAQHPTRCQASHNGLRTPHSGYHYDGTDRRFFEGWYFKVTACLQCCFPCLAGARTPGVKIVAATLSR